MFTNLQELCVTKMALSRVGDLDRSPTMRDLLEPLD